jgi:hypothetical protein
MGNTPGQLTAESPLNTALNVHDDGLVSLGNTVDALETRLAPVLGPRNAEAEQTATEDKPSVNSHTVERVQAHTSRLQQLENRLKDLLQALEV